MSYRALQTTLTHANQRRAACEVHPTCYYYTWRGSPQTSYSSNSVCGGLGQRFMNQIRVNKAAHAAVYASLLVTMSPRILCQE